MDTLIKLLNSMSTEIFAICIQMVVAGAVVLYLKDFSERIVNYFKLRMSDFGRGTKVTFDGNTGWITKISFRQVEIKLSEDSIMIVPVDRFLKFPKVIHTNIPEHD